MGADSHDSAVRFDTVLESELAEIKNSRSKRLPNLKPVNPTVEADLTGLALSGGDVRSATFGLGVFQGLARHGLLRRFDYLSSTGGGAEIAGWLLTWIRSQGLDEVEKQLAGGSGVGEAREIQGLRQSTNSPSRRGFGLTGSPSSVLTWLRNVAANLLTFAILFAGFVLFARGLLTFIYQLGRYDIRSTAIFAPAILGALLFGVFGRRAEKPPGLRWRRSWLFWAAVVLIILASFLASMGLSYRTAYFGYFERTRNAFFLFVYVFIFCLLAWLPRQRSLKLVLAQIAAAITAAALATILIIGLHDKVSPELADLLYQPLPPLTDSYLYTNDPSIIFRESMFFITSHISASMILIVLVIAFSLYSFIVSRWMSREERSLSWRFNRFLLCFASEWFLVTAFWNSNLPGAVQFMFGIPVVLLVVGGFVKAVEVRSGSKFKIVLETIERIAPYAFIFGLTAIVVKILSFATYQYYATSVVQIAIGIVVILVSLLLLWAMRESGFSIHKFHQARVLRNSIAPAASPEAQKSAGGDSPLSSLGRSDNAAPYPLFCASLDVVDVPTSFSIQPRTIPFLFSPLFSGFDSSRATESGPQALAAYRPTDKLGGGISLTDAIAMSRPFRDQSLRPSSAASAMLWTLFSVREGRFIGNPVRNDNWKRPGPIIEPLYALREGYGEFASEASYVRPSPGREFDNLGIYQLVKRKCRFIIACDATHDPEFAFNDLGATIRRCRTELGVEIDMGLGPFGRAPSSAGTHYQIAQIRYSAEETGMMIYIKPSLTGDEPIDLIQYGKGHEEFPASRVAEGNFDEFAFESYRRLGEHIVETVLTGIAVNAETPTTQIFNLIRQRLQPDFKPEEITPAATDNVVSLPPDELVEAIASGECVLCAGPGLAAQAKLPTWPAFVEGLLRAARDGGTIDAATAAGLAAALSAGELDAVADDLIHEMSRQQLVDYVHTATSAAEPSVAHRTLAGMKFLGALNTNVDSLVADAFGSRALVPADAEKLVEALRNNKFFVANPFGIHSNPSSLLFTMKEFRQLLSANSQFKQFLGTLFLRYTVIFIGSGIDGVRDFLEALELPNTPERPHYAIIQNASQIDPVKVRFLERSYNTRVIDYKPRFDFAGLPAFLKELEKKVNASDFRPRASGNLTLKSVSLENIGPFQSLHLDLTPSWNLLLGDNGVGKTVLLRAIAVALCGESANPDVVKRLLRSGASQGSIRLRDNNREYTVELKRQMDGSIKVTSASLSPIIYERWLVLGFPALRSITADSPKGPTKVTRHAPAVEDLLPLLSYEPDRRMSDIKQWLVNLDYASKSEYSAISAKRTRDDFIRVLQRLTPGLRLELGPIDTKTMQINVVSDAGMVPLELVSQGTVSVMSWIGTLLERLVETGTSRSESKNSVLVLIDELDAHMHPKWQQMFVDAFRKEFASVQIIATTHSPLLVGSLQAEEILHVRRTPLRSEIYGVVELKELDDGTRELLVLGPEEDDEDNETPAPSSREVKRYVISAKEKLAVKNGEIVEEGEPLTQDPTHVEVKHFTAKEDGWRADQILTSPLFELESTRNPQAAKLLTEYKELSVRQFHTNEQQEQLSRVAGELQIRLPTPHEKEEARQAYELIEDFAKRRLENIPEDWRRKVLDEVKLQLTESVTGSRRPE